MAEVKKNWREQMTYLQSEEGKAKPFKEWAELCDKVIEEEFDGTLGKLSMDLLLKKCVACGGNWNAMLFSGVKALKEEGLITDEEFTFVDEFVEVAFDGNHMFSLLGQCCMKLMCRVALTKMLEDN